MDQQPFILVTCQIGAESALKHEMSRRYPSWRFAYSRPGFLTFKLPADVQLAADFTLALAFARAHARCLGSIRGENLEQLAQHVWQLTGSHGFDRLHVWQRDQAAPGQRGFEPGLSEEARGARRAILQHATDQNLLHRQPDESQAIARPGDSVLDVVLVGVDEWWVGRHDAGSRASCWPGGFWPGTAPEDMISRAYLKVAEAIDWSGLPIKAGQRCVDIGCAPGGASQALLDRGLRVVGVDPAQVDPRVLARSEFTHVQKRGADLQRREYREFQWLVADMNVAPVYTLSTVLEIVTHRVVNLRGAILFLKLLDWKLADELPQYLAEVRSWGFDRVRARQLGHNRQEVCLTACQQRKRRRGQNRRRSHRTTRVSRKTVSAADAVNSQTP